MKVPGDMDSAAPDARMLAEAERWYARLKTGNCSASRTAAFQRWQAKPGRAAAYAHTAHLWDSIGEMAGNPELELMAAQALRATDPRRRRYRTGWHVPLALAASIAICALVLVFASGVLHRAPTAVAYTSGPHQGETVRLEDGSELVLNVDTRLTVRMGASERRLVLERGEAMFHVAHDPRRPFRVEAGNGTVTALGTRFQVRREPEQVTVTLLEGSVALARSAGGEQRQLEPGDQATYGDVGTSLALRKVDTEVASSWTRGRLLFRATPLAEVVAEVNRYAGKPLKLEDPSLGILPVSGTYPMNDSESVALALRALLPVEIAQGDDESIVLYRR